LTAEYITEIAPSEPYWLDPPLVSPYGAEYFVIIKLLSASQEDTLQFADTGVSLTDIYTF